MADIRAVSSGKNPYEVGSYTAKSNEKNTLTIESYFKLLSAQLAHQDMSNPMDNSEMMAQMTQMAMVQSQHDDEQHERRDGADKDHLPCRPHRERSNGKTSGEGEFSCGESAERKVRRHCFREFIRKRSDLPHRGRYDRVSFIRSDSDWKAGNERGNSRSNKRSGCKHGKYREHSGKRGELSCRSGIWSRRCRLSKRTEWKLRKKTRKNGFFLHFFIN